MGKIRLNDNTELDLISIDNGMQEEQECLNIYLKDTKSVEEYDSIFSDKEKTKKISVIGDDGEVLKVHNDFTTLKECGKVYGIVIEANTEKPAVGNAVFVMLYRQSDFEKRLEEVEEKVDGMGGGFDPELQAAVMLVVQFSAQSLPGQEAISAKILYETFDQLVEQKFTAKEKGYKFRDGEELYKTAQDNVTFQAQYRPGPGTESLYTHIDETHKGTLEDPIPWVPNMQPELNKYYKEGELIAKCIEDPGQALHNKLSELCPGRYFEAA